MESIKQVLVLRNDLNMRRGKSEVQAAHASLKVFLDRMAVFNNGSSMINFTPQIIEWIKGDFKKISLSCNNENELLHLQKLAEKAGVINALILDNGETEFKTGCEDCYGDGYHEVCPNCENKKIYVTRDADSFIRLFCDICKKFIDVAKKEKCIVCKGSGKINKPTYTALAIGPDYESRINPITQHLKLR